MKKDSPKQILRIHWKAVRASITSEQRLEAAHALLALPLEGNILSFASFGTEIDTSLLNAKLARENRLFLPEKMPNLNRIDLILVPGLAFDQRNFRLGYGKGFYDRLLTQTTVPSFGIGFLEQLTELLPTEPHDQPVTRLWLA